MIPFQLQRLGLATFRLKGRHFVAVSL